MTDVKRCEYEHCHDTYEPARSSADDPSRFCDDICESNAAAYASGYGIAEPAPFEIPPGSCADVFGGVLISIEQSTK